MIRKGSRHPNPSRKGTGHTVPFVFNGIYHANAGFAGKASSGNFIAVRDDGNGRDGSAGKRKGQLWKQPTVNDCLPYEKEVCVGALVRGGVMGTISLPDDVKLQHRPTGRESALTSPYDLKDPAGILKASPAKGFNQKTH
jgi:hypothetical protein